MIDLHAHILPAIDDGPRTIEDALAMARMAVAAGTRAVATTCHVGYVLNVAPDAIVRGRAALADRLEQEGIELELLAGGEIAPNRLPDLDDDELRALALGGGPYVLLECPLSPTDVAIEDLVDDLHRRGFGVLLAHPERSPMFQRDLTRLAALVDAGALAQVTAGALIGDFGTIPRRAALDMLAADLLHVLASDGHDAVQRPPTLAVGDVVDAVRHEWMTTAVPEAIVTGQPLPPLRSWSAQ